MMYADYIIGNSILKTEYETLTLLVLQSNTVFFFFLQIGVGYG